MAQQPIRMTEGFRKANVQAGQLTDADVDGQWQMPPNISADAREEFLEILQRVPKPISPDQTG